MKHVGEEINRLVEEKRIAKINFCKAINISPGYYSVMTQKPSIQCELLERICRVLGVSPATFFDDCPTATNQIGDVNNTAIMGTANITITQGEVERLRELLNEKERTIQILMAAKGFNAGTNTGQQQ